MISFNEFILAKSQFTGLAPGYLHTMKQVVYNNYGLKKMKYCKPDLLLVFKKEYQH